LRSTVRAFVPFSRSRYYTEEFRGSLLEPLDARRAERAPGCRFREFSTSIVRLPSMHAGRGTSPEELSMRPLTFS